MQIRAARAAAWNVAEIANTMSELFSRRTPCDREGAFSGRPASASAHDASPSHD
jgi:hypothetical protein